MLYLLLFSLGERRIRVHTLCIPVTNQITEVFASADQQAVAALLAKMGELKFINSFLLLFSVISLYSNKVACLFLPRKKESRSIKISTSEKLIL